MNNEQNVSKHKKVYEEPKLTIIELKSEDVLTAACQNQTPTCTASQIQHAVCH